MKIFTVIYYITALALPITAGLIYLLADRRRNIFKRKAVFIFGVLLAIAGLTLSYTRFIEPQIILTKETEIETGFDAKIVLISDIHLGVYKGKGFLSRVAKRINSIENVDAVMIAGDLVYWPSEDVDSLTDLFSPLADLDAPVYAVLGNHDSERPGPKIAKQLAIALERNGVHFLHNEHTRIEGTDITVLGVGDRWAKQDETELIEQFNHNDNLIVLLHNPDSVVDYRTDIADLTLAGHAHGGQIRIPFLYKHMIPCEEEFDTGLYELDNGKLFISSGLGEVRLPMRFAVPPTIDVLILK